MPQHAPEPNITETCQMDIPVDYTGCESKLDRHLLAARAEARVKARHKALKQIATHLELLETLEEIAGAIKGYLSGDLDTGLYDDWDGPEGWEALLNKAKTAIALARP